MSLLPILCAPALLAGGGGPAGTPPPPPAGAVHSVAFINDPLSHGQVGDAFLSFNEAIRLHNGTLLSNQLSAAEAAQVQLIPGTGTQTFLSWASFDGSSTPVVTVQQDFDPILDTSFGFYVSSTNEPTRLDFSTSTGVHGLRVPANSFEMRDVILSGGRYGIDCTQTDVSGQAGLVLDRVGFENLAQFGLHVLATTPNGIGRCYLSGCWFLNTNSAVTFTENVAGRTTIFELHDCRIAGGQAGVDVVLGAGGSGRYTFDRVVIDTATTGLRLLRPGGANRSALIEGLHVEVRSGTTAASIACAPTGVTWATLRMAHLRAGLAGTALQLGALGDSVYGDLEECVLEGDVAVLGGAGPLPIAWNNVRCRNGAVDLGTSAAQPLAVNAARFDNCAVQTHGGAPIPFTDCCFAGGSLAGTAPAPVQGLRCYAPAAGPFVTLTASVPAEQLGSMKLLPDAVVLGGMATFQMDLPNGLFGVFLLGFTDPAPALLPQPLHVYSVPAFTFTLPGVYRFQQSFAWSIPNSPGYLGIDLVAQCAVLPDPGVAAPPVQLPPGRRFRLQ